MTNITRRTALRGATAALAALALPLSATGAFAPPATVPADLSLQVLIFAWREQHDLLADLNAQLRKAPDQQAIDRLSNRRMSVAGDENEARNAMLRAIIREARA